MGFQPAAKLLHGAVLRALGLSLSKMLAKTVGDVGANEGLVASKAQRWRDLFEIFDDVLREPEGDQGHLLFGLHIALDAFTHLHSVFFLMCPPDARK